MKSKGFTWLEMMVAMLVISLLFTLILQIVKLFPHLSSSREGISQKDTFEIQLQHEILLSDNFQLNQQELCYLNLEGMSRCIVFEKDRIVRTPGYEILLTKVNNYRVVLMPSKIEMRYDYENEAVVSSFIKIKS